MSVHSKAFLGAIALAAVAASGASCSVEAYCFDCPDSGTTQAPGVDGGGGSGGSVLCSVDKDCPSAQKCCSNACIDTQSSVDHCGACGTACDAALNGSSLCEKGSCTLKCTDGYGDCNLLSIDGCEALVSSDPLNCGGCGKPCVLANAVGGCAMSKCSIAMCKGGFADCNMMAMDGCESNLGADPLNCNACGDKCPTPPNSSGTCVAGVCGTGGCVDGYGDCDGNPVNGCETKLGDDTLNCGTCGTVCPTLPQAGAGCVAGVCGVGACDPGYADCDLSIWSGCESKLDSDVNNCGACGAPCGAIAHGFPKCDASMCAIGGCDPGYADCDGALGNGCEVNLASDLQNCGACANTCPVIANGQPTCSGFACGLGTCNAGFADCFGGAADGCETNLLTDVGHCGTCGTVCPAVAEGAKACDLGVCGVASCVNGWSNCNGQPADGCEVNTQTDANNCGNCGNACPVLANASNTCTTGVCGLGACKAGFSDCNNNPADGCEFNTSSDPSNCGGCGIKCGSAQTCAAGKCSCSKAVLVIEDDSPSGTATLAAALTSQGYAVTQTAVPSYQYNGTNPGLAGFGAVVLLAGGPGSTSFTTDMPAAGQAAILAFVNTAGNGLVLTEWAAYQVLGGRWQTLAPLVLLNRTVAYSGQVTYTVDPGFASHPIWTGLPASFTFASNSNVGVSNAANGATRIAGSPQAIDGVAIRDTPVGRVVHVSHAGNYAPNGWSNANIQTLVGNAVGWSARCQ